MANTQTVTPGDYLYEILTHACGQWDAREVERSSSTGVETHCVVFTLAAWKQPGRFVVYGMTAEDS